MLRFLFHLHYPSSFTVTGTCVPSAFVTTSSTPETSVPPGTITVTSATSTVSLSASNATSTSVYAIPFSASALRSVSYYRVNTVFNTIASVSGACTVCGASGMSNVTCPSPRLCSGANAVIKIYRVSISFMTENRVREEESCPRMPAAIHAKHTASTQALICSNSTLHSPAGSSQAWKK